MFEYKVIPAPSRGSKAKGVKGTQARFANTLQTLMNELGADGWEYQRADTLPVEERQGLTGKATSYQNMLVFRRALNSETEPQSQVAALIEDQTEIVEDDSIAAELQEEALPAEPAPDVNEPDEQTADELAKNAKARVDETLKAEPFAFPWDKRAKPAKSNDEDAKLPAE